MSARAEARELALHCLERADYAQRRREAIADAGQFGTVLEAPGGTRSYIGLTPEAVRGSAQLELELPGYAERAEIRRELATKIEHEVFPTFCPRWLEHVPEKLRTARRSGCFGVRLETGLPIVYWDNKAGLSRLCPDDAREEAMRLRRRVLLPLEQLQQHGHQLTYAVFTTPNAAPLKLRAEMESIYKRFRAVLKAFPQIKGALCVLEAPLGRGRDWNVHINVILATQGFFDWKALRARWHWNVELRKLSREPGSIGCALSELIKYAVAATVSKSADHAEAGTSPAPPMLAWSGLELREWLEAMHGFRRTRTYGELYGLEAPGPEDPGPIAWLGLVQQLEEGGRARYVHRLALIDSIPEDKSRPGCLLSAYQQLRRRVSPPEWTAPGGELPRLSELA